MPNAAADQLSSPWVPPSPYRHNTGRIRRLPSADESPPTWPRVGPGPETCRCVDGQIVSRTRGPPTLFGGSSCAPGWHSRCSRVAKDQTRPVPQTQCPHRHPRCERSCGVRRQAARPARGRRARVAMPASSAGPRRRASRPLQRARGGHRSRMTHDRALDVPALGAGDVGIQMHGGPLVGPSSTTGVGRRGTPAA
jgi:hypothetical protein